MAVVECPAPLLNSCTHSDPLAMSNPLSFRHKYCPPAIQRFLFALSARNGAVNRGLGSGTDTSRIACVVPSLRPQLVVNHNSRYVYSSRILQPSSGSTMMSPPSPPNGDPILPLPVRSSGSSS